MFFAIFNTILLGFIAAIHFYWALGGKWGVEAAIPTTKEEATAFRPGSLATSVVASGLLVMALFHLVKVNLIDLSLPVWIDNFALKIIAFIFLARAIGEFRYVGFFKKIRNTKFARLDTRVYSPLCLLLSMNALLTALQS
jgi:protein-S-isoprenylcysteine O-methyltransferase Ste14